MLLDIEPNPPDRGIGRGKQDFLCNENKTVYFAFADDAGCSGTLSSFIILEHGISLYQGVCGQQ
jgi:hypothetical protein